MNGFPSPRIVNTRDRADCKFSQEIVGLGDRSMKEYSTG